ncbi:unnamed protein product [Pleuronectes platessa]|uniref:CCHC-type domain-containing protein n=1 Tax=Pleuronectes platessa TaxID=8262 RepID=A0A9N7UK74_PLEPL|nr:unnamed protein product [Pleuronectes platessa]
MKCFGCGREGHLIRLCPDGAGGGQSAASAPGPPRLPIHQENEVRNTHTDTRGAEAERSDEEEFKKLSAKRKNPENKTNSDQATKMSKKNPPCSSSQSEERLTEPQENKQVDEEGFYTFTSIRTFLQQTKGSDWLK